MDGAAQLAELADRVVGAEPKFDATEQRVAVALYRMLGEGAPVAITRLAAALRMPEETIRTTLDCCAVFYDRTGAVVGFGGLTVVEMPPHTLIVNGRRLYTWCAWDSLFIPGILGKTAHLESLCPVTRSPVSMTVTPAGVRDLAPPTAVVSFLTPNRRFDQNVIDSFCHFVHFFQTPQAGEEWTSRHPGTFLLSVEEAFALGQLTNARNFGDALAVKSPGGG